MKFHPNDVLSKLYHEHRLRKDAEQELERVTRPASEPKESKFRRKKYKF